jgi:hypothetical protein
MRPCSHAALHLDSLFLNVCASCPSLFLEEPQSLKRRLALLQTPSMRNAYSQLEVVMLCCGALGAALTLFAVARLAFASFVPTSFPYNHGHGDKYGGKLGPLGAVASESSLCSQVGVDMLRAGGNAADAIGNPPNQAFSVSVHP